MLGQGCCRSNNPQGFIHTLTDAEDGSGSRRTKVKHLVLADNKLQRLPML
jgi:hypothetical protein